MRFCPVALPQSQIESPWIGHTAQPPCPPSHPLLWLPHPSGDDWDWGDMRIETSEEIVIYSPVRCRNGEKRWQNVLSATSRQAS
jgi:hypothetical protein